MSELVRNTSHIALHRAFGVKEFGEAMEKAMAGQSKESKKKSFAPSSLGYAGSCPRYWWYAFNGATFDSHADALAVANMNNGTLAGERIAKVLEDMGVLIEAERPVQHQDPPIGGFIDAVITWKGAEVIVEVKTTRSSTWNQRVLNDEVPIYQLAQLLIYMYTQSTERGFFMTENKDTHELWIKPVKMTEQHKKFVEGIFEWMRTVKANVDSPEGQLPTRPFNKSSFKCKGCAVRDTCWAGWTRGSVNGSDPNPGTITIPPLELTLGG
jgi:CRISPR/Cas system-associated exonuclease Cas4 (RecB family)